MQAGWRVIIWLEYSFWYTAATADGPGRIITQHIGLYHAIDSQVYYTDRETYIVLDHSDVTRRHEAEIT